MCLAGHTGLKPKMRQYKKEVLTPPKVLAMGLVVVV